MDFFFSGLFWGMILILLGISIIIRIVFHIHLPLVRIVFALVLIYFGIRILVGGNWLCSSSRSTTCFGGSNVTASSGAREYKTVFGSTNIDATAGITGATPERMSVKTVFGETKLIVASSVPTIVRADAAFGEARFPDGNSITFGSTVWKNSAAKAGAVPQREIDTKVIFGSFVVMER